MPKPGRKPSPAKLLERQVTEQVRDFLKYHGWRPVRHQRMALPGSFQTGENGQADYSFIRYLSAETKLPGAALILWIEFKSPTDRRSCRCIAGESRLCGFCEQKRWQDRERARGGIVWVVDDFEWFEDQYNRTFGWLHTGAVKGQMDLLAALR